MKIVAWERHVGRMREGSILVRKPARKRLLGTPWRPWEDNIKMEFQDVGMERMDLSGTGDGLV